MVLMVLPVILVVLGVVLVVPGVVLRQCLEQTVFRTLFRAKYGTASIASC